MWIHFYYDQIAHVPIDSEYFSSNEYDISTYELLFSNKTIIVREVIVDNLFGRIVIEVIKLDKVVLDCDKSLN
ncbi:MAG: hypothetical protein US54_C0045G0007 [Candidatus Roizmanbacteria bacterium GW2011_GWA2_37_7]|uniref:Uncharacterized protein n=1 Tax=Candidatus Roizmanbacteria bacterium GW2011_GWA2_37_7 TaxID=1618481 RepID=A0A0G0K930_9BACT|nr:MAG: hypothetical protein US54_C0045G0007 [Candidatus Roizmanbacteria bacterium GW2011_GWA2_37_7]